MRKAPSGSACDLLSSLVPTKALQIRQMPYRRPPLHAVLEAIRAAEYGTGSALNCMDHPVVVFVKEHVMTPATVVRVLGPFVHVDGGSMKLAAKSRVLHDHVGYSMSPITQLKAPLIYGFHRLTERMFCQGCLSRFEGIETYYSCTPFGQE